MTLADILGVSPANAGDLIGKIKKKNRKIKFGNKEITIEDCLKMYDPNKHDIHDNTLRPDKIIWVPDPSLTEEQLEAGAGELVMQVVKLNRSSAPTQKLIVKRANAFLTGNPIDFIYDTKKDAKKETLVEVIQRIWDNNKLDYKNNKIGRMMMSETHVAELWYIIADEDATDDFEGLQINTSGVTMRMKIIGKSLGDDLYPIYDRTGKMIAFCRGYTETDDDDKKTEVMEVYTKSTTIKISREETTYRVERKDNIVNKIPIIYYSQDEPEWLDVEANIKRSETLISNFGDTNDYYASPTTVVKGEVEGFSKKGEAGKLLEVEKDAEVSLLEWSNSTEAVDLEKKMQKEIIMDGTQTPDISFESMKGLGVFSGIALKMLFFDASLKVKDKAETYGESMQRRINFIKACIAKMDNSFESAALMPIKPKIEAYMPENLEERMSMLATATGDKPTMSQETAVGYNPMIEDKEQEIIRLKKEQADLASSQLEM